jgi:hypothetical protein
MYTHTHTRVQTTVHVHTHTRAHSLTLSHTHLGSVFDEGRHGSTWFIISIQTRRDTDRRRLKWCVNYNTIFQIVFKKEVGHRQVLVSVLTDGQNSEAKLFSAK